MQSYNPPKQDVQVAVIIKGNDKYVFIFNKDRRCQVMQMLGKFAADPSLNFTWKEAAVVSNQIYDGEW